ncbi:hypothetical protein [Clostridium butyricum]|uniref:Uncharacterized protein n=1 Tax=Clostridium butyricum TaxID=1492 RepID=A0A6N3GTB4_CLOBU
MRYVNLLTKEVNNWCESDVKQFDTGANVLLDDLDNKIVLVSLNNYKLFNSSDVLGFEKNNLRHYLNSGYKAWGDLSKNTISRLYNLCDCGAELPQPIDKERMIILDCDKDFNAVGNMKFNIVQSCVCGECGDILEISTKPTKPTSERAALLRECMQLGNDVIIRASYRVDNIKYNIHININEFVKLPFLEFTNWEYRKIINRVENSIYCDANNIDFNRLATCFINSESLLRYIIREDKFLNIECVSDISGIEVVTCYSELLKKNIKIKTGDIDYE